MIHTLDAVSGWSAGYQYAVAKNKEDEVVQGKNAIIGGGCQAAQLGALGIAVNRSESPGR